jgi:hypothetical protein
VDNKQWEIIKLRREISFALSDYAAGGPDKSEQIAKWLKEIRILTGEDDDTNQL